SMEAADLLSIVCAIKEQSIDCILMIKCATRRVVRNLTVNCKSNYDNGWFGNPNAPLYRTIICLLRARQAKTYIQYVPIHSEALMKNVHKLAKSAADKRQVDNIDLTYPADFDIPGMSLKHLTQSRAYKYIKSLKCVKDRTSTVANLDRARYANGEISGPIPSDYQLWKSIRTKDVRRPIRDFLWRAMHSTYKVGRYWSHVKEKEYWAICPICQCNESMEHILTECPGNGQETIWALARDFWKNKHPHWPKPSLGSILSCTSTSFGGTAKRTRATNRMYRILIAESAHLIWKLRCRRIFNSATPTQPPTHAEVQHKWKHAMEQRMQLDFYMSLKGPSTKSLPRKLVAKTWSHTPLDRA
ncbi:hypothetical protein EXIGLDRAFT_588143, partial [Exidia glandulosa HHB12029]